MTFTAVVVAFLILLPSSLRVATAAEPGLPELAEVLSRVNAQSAATTLRERFEVSLEGRGGSTRSRGLVVYRRHDAREARTALFFTDPPNVKGTALLVHDPADAGTADALWLYLPAMRTVRRVAAGGRGEDFFGTDFSLLEVSTDTRLREDLLRFELRGRERMADLDCLRLDAEPRDATLAKEVAYSRAEYCIEEATWLPRRVLLRDGDGRAVKEIRFDDLRRVGQGWRVYRRSAHKFASGHRSVFVTTERSEGLELPDSLFTERGLSQGPPATP